MTIPLTRRAISTPLGTLTLVATDRGLGGAYFDDHRHRPRTDHLPTTGADAVLAAAEHAYRAYFAGEASDVAVPADVAGTAFQRAVWAELSRIPAGQTRTYAQIADAIERPSAVRAVAGAIAANPLTVAVPCHRVVGADGSLTGYAGGLERKRWLLDHEGAAARVR